MKGKPPRLVVLASGEGSNFEALAEAVERGEVVATIAALVSDRPGAACLRRAGTRGIAALALPPRGLARKDYDSLLADTVASFGPDWIFLLGWMRLLSRGFLDRFPARVINLHPALPGTFPGKDAIARAHAAGLRGELSHTGVMLHLVPDEGVDSGPVLASRQVALARGEELPALERRMHAAEHELLLDFASRLGHEPPAAGIALPPGKADDANYKGV